MHNAFPIVTNIISSLPATL